jgi:large subunit ribosomal protein L25
MAAETIIEAQLRMETGTGAARRLRRQGILPASVCVKAGTPIDIQLNQHVFDMMLIRHSGDNLIADLKIPDQPTRKVLLTEVQRNTVSGHSEHADFHEVAMDEKMHISVSVELKGEPIGVTRDGGMLDQPLHEIDIEVLPGDIIESIEVDVSELEVGDALRISDLTIPAGVTVLTDPNVAVAGVSAAREAEEEEEEDEPSEAAATPEVIGEKKEEQDGKPSA